jgi:hypothetical protein
MARLKTNRSLSVFLFALIVISALYWAVGSLYVTTSREIKRYDVSPRPTTAQTCVDVVL